MKKSKKAKRRKIVSKEKNLERAKTKVKCPFCSNEDKTYLDRNKIVEHLIVTKDSKDHFHVHGPVTNTELIKEFIVMIAKESNIEIEDED